MNDLMRQQVHSELLDLRYYAEINDKYDLLDLVDNVLNRYDYSLRDREIAFSKVLKYFEHDGDYGMYRVLESLYYEWKRCEEELV